MRGNLLIGSMLAVAVLPPAMAPAAVAAPAAATSIRSTEWGQCLTATDTDWAPPYYPLEKVDSRPGKKWAQVQPCTSGKLTQQWEFDKGTGRFTPASDRSRCLIVAWAQSSVNRDHSGMAATAPCDAEPEKSRTWTKQASQFRNEFILYLPNLEYDDSDPEEDELGTEPLNMLFTFRKDAKGENPPTVQLSSYDNKPDKNGRWTFK